MLRTVIEFPRFQNEKARRRSNDAADRVWMILLPVCRANIPPDSSCAHRTACMAAQQRAVRPGWRNLADAVSCEETGRKAVRGRIPRRVPDESRRRVDSARTDLYDSDTSQETATEGLGKLARPSVLRPYPSRRGFSGLLDGLDQRCPQPTATLSCRDRYKPRLRADGANAARVSTAPCTRDS